MSYDQGTKEVGAVDAKNVIETNGLREKDFHYCNKETIVKIESDLKVFCVLQTGKLMQST